IDAAASNHRTGSHESWDGKNPKWMMLSSATKPPAFEATDRNAVTGVGAPSYVSGVQKWKGTALTLNANPPSVRKIATARSVEVPCAAMWRKMSLSSVDPPVSP